MVGIFNNKQSDDNYQNGADQPMPQVQPSNTDGVMSTPAQTQTAVSQDEPTDQSAPPLVSDDTAGDYIVTDPPQVVSAAPAAEPNPDLPEIPQTQAAPVQDAPVVANPVSIVPDTPDASSDEPVDQEVPDVTSQTESDDLSEIKKQALEQLSPLVGHLDQSPEDKFHTAMMMLQATDDKKLVKTAYKAAQDIADDKVRAKALLDIVNEINYFTEGK